MKLNEIRTFVTVAQTGSVQAAARQLHMTQSAVSRLVQRLELDLGATLFDRQTKPLALTHDGQAALDHGRRVLDAAEAFSDALAPTAPPMGVLRIGTAHALAEVVAERPLDQLRSGFPDLTLQISVDWTAPLLKRLDDGSLDAAVITLLTDGPPKTELPARCLGREDVRIIGAASHASTRWRSLRAMNEVGWVIQPESCGYRVALTQALERVGAGPPRVIVEAYGKNLQLSVVARGAGFGLLPASQMKKIPVKQKIKAFNVPDFRLTVSTWFVRRRQPGRLSRPLDAMERTLSGALYE
ncbi:LysR family transcriptional regulator [Bradyrhizobium septentrionale]|uniref:LysR family transcriptional regulator n=1 Tax=Bradyrhizobium septentrionale TaxID=1404411 RepID=A0A974A051_9BRAD|nr:LysR family transcriptional regulator [Bradyrhizobium septentrionale]UGY12601.1 LysR family transcriptional regulator [Bradyrhizobium septentrionale]UGY21146.1 LysR family transcriptional regulator [Bradyrhizobium septentrionale]